MHPVRGVVAGETLVDLFPDGAGDLSTVDAFRHRPGGAPANVTIGLARLETAPLFWTRLGSDPFGDYLADALADEGVPDRFVVRAPDPTALAVVSPTPDGDRSFSFYEQGTATLDFDAGTVPDDALAAREWVHIGGVPLVREGAREAFFAFADCARDRDCTVTFDPNYRADLWADDADAGDVLADAIARTDVLFCSPDDLAPLDLATESETVAAAARRDDPENAADDPEAVAAALLDRGPHTVFLTRGGEGATAASDATASGDRRVVTEPALDVDVADTTGAGDAFTAAALWRYEPGLDAAGLSEVLRFANAAGALATTRRGAMAALPGVSEIRDALGA